MKEDWDDAIEFVLKMEGDDKITNDPNDPGGLTKFGISQKAYPSKDIENLTREDAKAIYHADYWLPCKCDDLPRPFAIAMFDMAVNQGARVAKRTLQLTLGLEAIDGVIGPKTLEAAAKAGPPKVRRYLAERLAQYSRLITANPNLLEWAPNWSNRVLCLFELILKTKSVA